MQPTLEQFLNIPAGTAAAAIDGFSLKVEVPARWLQNSEVFFESLGILAGLHLGVQVSGLPLNILRETSDRPVLIYDIAQ